MVHMLMSVRMLLCRGLELSPHLSDSNHASPASVQGRAQHLSCCSPGCSSGPLLEELYPGQPLPAGGAQHAAGLNLDVRAQGATNPLAARA